MSAKNERVVEMLLRRGLVAAMTSPPKNLLIPARISAQRKTELYEMLKNYSFRLVLRDIIKYQTMFKPTDLTRFCSLERVKEYISFLLSIDIIRKIDRGYKLSKGPISSFGDTLEWFVAQVFELEFFADVIWGIRFKNSSSGGDYDVIAAMEGNLIYIEVKSSPPKHIELGEVTAFINRIEDMLPDMAIFLVDTELRMKDKIVPLFEEELKTRGSSIKRIPIERMTDELFHVENQIFIINSRRDIIENLRVCFRRFLRSKIRIL